MSQLPWILVSLVFLMDAHCQAATAATSGQANFRLERIENNGAAIPVETTSILSWRNSPKASDPPEPVFELRIPLPEGHQFRGLHQPEQQRLIRNTRAIRLAKNSGVSLELTGWVESFRLLTSRADGSSKDLSFISRTQPGPPVLLVHGSCNEAGITAIPDSEGDGKLPSLFAAVFCRQVPQSNFVEVYFLPSGETKVDTASRELSQKRRQLSSGWSVFVVSGKKHPKGGAYFYGKIKVKLADGRRAGEYIVLSSAPASATFVNPLRLTAGAGITYVTYGERITAATSTTRVDLTEATLTGKITLAYPIPRSGFELGANAFANLFALTHSPSEIPSTLFYGFNGRIGYQLPWAWNGLRSVISTGWYVWGMHTANDAYGLKSLSGPQVFLSIGRSSSSRPWFGYAKFAPSLNDQGSVSLDNRELAIGGGLLIGSRQATRPLFLTLDLSDASYILNNAKNRISFNTISIGIQTSFSP